MRARIVAIALSVALMPTADGGAQAKRQVVLLDIDGPIGPATSDYFHRSLEKAERRQAAAIVLRMDTPGGLDSAMRDIIQDILASPIPVITYVSPSGARAASAGTYILYASHVAAMAPATNLGAATPIQIGGLPIPKPQPSKPESGGDDGETGNAPAKPHPTMADKLLSDAVAYIRSLAQMRGRNVEWAEKAVREAASLSAEEALAANVIDLVAGDLDGLLSTIDGRRVSVRDEERRLATADAEITAIEPDWRTELLGVITNPNVAYVLMLIGFYGLVLEFAHPGALAPGVVGTISLLLALFALHVMPINYAGLGLILLGLAFMIAEAFLPSFGALGIGGVIAFVIGSVMLLDTGVPGYGVSWPVIATVGGAGSTFFVLALTMAVKARRRPVVSGQEELIGSAGEVADWDGREGRIRVRGELWLASAGGPLEPGTAVRVTAIDGLTLIVEPAAQRGEST